MDPVEIGKRIRKYRKEKRIVLQDLSDLFSMGKLSNIEKGKIPVVIDDIKLICERLEVPLESIVDQEQDQNIYEINSELSHVRSLITLGHYTSARKILKETQQKIIENKIEHLLPEASFYYGIYHLKRRNYKFAKVFFKEVIDDDSVFQHASKFKIRSSNAISYLEFMRGRLSSALKYNNDAVNFIRNLQVHSYEDEANVYLNKAIFNTHLGDYRTAFRYANSALEISKGSVNQSIRFFMSVLQILKGESEAAEINLSECIEYYQREGEIKSLIQALISQYYLYYTNPGKYKKNIEVIENSVHISLVHDFTDFNSIPHLQIFAELAILNKRYEFTEVLIDKLMILMNKFPEQHNIFHKSYHLKARLIRETSNNKEKEIDLLMMSLRYLGDEESINRALILHELALVTDDYQGLYSESNAIFYNLLGRDFEGFNIIKYCTPDPRF